MHFRSTLAIALCVSSILSCKIAGIDFQSPESSFLFDNGTITGLSDAGKSSTNIWVPETLGGIAVTAIGESAFSYATKLESLRLPDSIASIGEQAFCGCSMLQSMALPASLAALGQWNQSFWDCTAIASFSIDPANPSFSVIDGALYNKEGTKLLVYPAGKATEAFVLPSTVTEIDGNAFRNATGIASFSVAAGNTAFSAADGVLYNSTGSTMIAYPASKAGATFSVLSTVSRIEEGFRGASQLSSIEIPSSVTYINSWAFWHCSSLVSISLPDSITELGGWCVFDGCTSAKSIRLPSGIKSIGYGLFRNCYALTSLTVPAGVTSIGERAFIYCVALTTLELEPTTPPTFAANTFEGCSALSRISVPANSLDAYKTAAGWSDFAAIIIGR